MDNEPAKTKIQALLPTTESLLWSGRPRQGFIFRKFDSRIVVFSFVWGGLAIGSGWFTFESGAPAVILLFDVAIVAICVYLVSARFIFDYLARRSTYYGITDRRLFFLCEFPTTKKRSLEIPKPNDVTVIPDAGMSGSISFGPDDPMKRWLGQLNLSGMSACRQTEFFLIEDAQSVLDILKRTGTDLQSETVKPL